MTIWCTDVRPDANQKVDNVVMTPADSIVKGGDAFIVGIARVNHLWKKGMHLLFKNKDTNMVLSHCCREAKAVLFNIRSSMCCLVQISLDLHAPLVQLSAPSPVHRPVLHLTPGCAG